MAGRMCRPSCGGNSAYSTVADTLTEACVSPPAAPSNLVAEAGPSVVQLTWVDNSDNEEGFKISRCVDLDCVHITVGANVIKYDDHPCEGKGEVDPLIYAYCVLAYNQGGESACSEPAEAMVECGKAAQGAALPAVGEPSQPRDLPPGPESAAPSPIPDVPVVAAAPEPTALAAANLIRPQDIATGQENTAPLSSIETTDDTAATGPENPESATQAGILTTLPNGETHRSYYYFNGQRVGMREIDAGGERVLHLLGDHLTLPRGQAWAAPAWPSTPMGRRSARRCATIRMVGCAIPATQAPSQPITDSRGSGVPVAGSRFLVLACPLSRAAHRDSRSGASAPRAPPALRGPSWARRAGGLPRLEAALVRPCRPARPTTPPSPAWRACKASPSLGSDASGWTIRQSNKIINLELIDITGPSMIYWPRTKKREGRIGPCEWWRRCRGLILAI